MVSSYEVATLCLNDKDSFSEESIQKIRRVCDYVDPILNSNEDLGIEFGTEIINNTIRLKLAINIVI